MKKTIDFSGYSMNTGFAIQIAIGNGKFAYIDATSKAAIIGLKMGWKMSIVKFFGCCVAANINDRAHDHQFPIPIWINGMTVSNLINQIATDEECLSFFREYNLLKEANLLTKEEYKIFLGEINLLGINCLNEKQLKHFLKKIRLSERSYSITS